jgi:hypothetical protein
MNNPVKKARELLKASKEKAKTEPKTPEELKPEEIQGKS